MPEGPECYKLSVKLNKILQNKRIIKINILKGRYETHGPPDNLIHFNDIISSNNITITNVLSKGKLIYFTTNTDFVILNTLGLFGNWVKKQNDHCNIELLYEPLSNKNNYKSLYFQDKIQYGTLKIVTFNELNKKLNELGPDVLNPKEFTWEYFEKMCHKNQTKCFPVVLLNQKNVSGIGNYMKSEILYSSNASVISPIKDYNLDQLKNVYSSCIIVGQLCKQNNYKLKVYNQTKDPYNNNVCKIKTLDKRTTYWVPKKMPIDIKKGVNYNTTLLDKNNNINENNNININENENDNVPYIIDLSSESSDNE